MFTLKYLILSHFDENDEPKVFFQAPGLIEEEILSEIPQLLVRRKNAKGVFMYAFGNYKSANYLFEISAEAEPKQLLASIVLSEYDLNFKLSQELLKGFEKELKQIEGVYKAFYLRSNKYPDSRKTFNQVQKLFFTFDSTFPEENIIQHKKDMKIFVFGLNLAGKTSILKAFQEKPIKDIKPTLNVDISRIRVENLSMVIYDAPGQAKLKGLWEPYLHMDLEGLIFVLDILHRMKFEKAKELLHEIANQPELKDLPLLILFNKADLIKEPDVSAYAEEMEIYNLKQRPTHYFLTSAKTGEGIEEAFEWLAREIS